VRSVSAVLRLLPEPVALGLGWTLGWFVGSVLRIRRRVVRQNLELAFPGRDAAWRRRVASRVFPHIGREAITLMRLDRWTPRELEARTSMEGFDELREAMDEGRGALVLTGHLGNWEIGGGAVAARGIPLDVVAQRQKNPRVNERLQRTRERLGMSVIYRKQAPRDVLRSLRAGRAVAMVADQNVRTGGLFVDFFGVPASTARGPGLFALRTGTPVFVASAIRLPGGRARYRVRFRRLDPGPADQGEAAIRSLTRRYLEALEAAVLEAPEQYFWPHRRWKTRPEGRDAEGGDGLREEPEQAEPV
jgi:Kdo2-lipid IVA lauroyltransferase/acyltransferase